MKLTKAEWRSVWGTLLGLAMVAAFIYNSLHGNHMTSYPG